MAFFDFFRKNEEHCAEHLADVIVKRIVLVINEHLTEIRERLWKIETKQKETSLQLEEIDGFLQNDSSETTHIDTLTALIDSIGDFYYYAAADSDSPLFEQAQMMWDAAKIAAESVELEIIDVGNEPFDFHFHSAESTEQDNSLPNGYVIRTLKCGYIYKDEIIRRAAVVINKIERNDVIYIFPREDDL